MPMTSDGTETRVSPAPRRRGAGARTPAQRFYVVCRVSTAADGTTRTSYELPDAAAPLTEAEYRTWQDRHVPAGRAAQLIALLVIRELLDAHGCILTCVLERRHGVPNGSFYGEPARVSFAGPADQVRLYRVTASGRLREIVPTPEPRPAPVTGLDHFAGEEAAIRRWFGPSVRIVAVRGPTWLEDLIGVSSVLHIERTDGVTLACGLGWHGSTPFLLRAEFPRFECSPTLPAAERAAVALAAVTAGLTTYETRLDARGPAMVARAMRNGELHLIRPAEGGARVEPYKPGIPPSLLTPDQAKWVRYAAAHEALIALDAYSDGRSDGVILLASDNQGRVTCHMIDADGVEVWRAAADNTAIAAYNREIVTNAPQAC